MGSRLGRILGAAVVAGSIAVPALVVTGADATIVPASRRTSYAPNVIFPVAGGRAVDQRTFGKRPGTEIKASCTNVVRAAHPGTAVVTSSRTAGPNLVRIVASRRSLTTSYGYMRAATVKTGQLVQAGQPIGYVGHLGIAKSCSLYFAVTSAYGTRTLNPSKFLDTYVGKPMPTRWLFDNTGFVLASFNTLGASHTPAGSRYPTYAWRTPRQVALLGTYGVDVVGLQEFQKPQRASFLATAGSTYGIFPATAYKTDTENSIIWRNSTMELVSATTFDVPYFDGHPRKMPIVLLRHRQSGREAYFINVHNPASVAPWGNQTQWRQKAIAIERAKIVELRASGKAVFLTGDLNDRAPAFCPLTQGKLMLAPNSIPSMTCSMPAKNYGIDWVLAAGPARFSQYGYDWTPKTQRLTDHPIVWARTHIAAQ
ncbi:MAG: peptidoglycan DD-metalloendopeptidase family protein [Nocardioidaceae bacterium]|nr:peptidoglycan DD-metalloendopeptidase family protein [Nocardioidaceae bacterium]